MATVTSIARYRDHIYSGPKKSRKRVNAQLKRFHGDELGNTKISRVAIWRKKLTERKNGACNIKNAKAEAINEGFQCNACSEQIVGFRYTCGQCPDYDLCVACKTRGCHSDHYMQRVPGLRTYSKVRAVQRNQLVGVVKPAGDDIADVAVDNAEDVAGDNAADVAGDNAADDAGDDVADDNDDGMKEVEVKVEADPERDPLQDAPDTVQDTMADARASFTCKQLRCVMKYLLLQGKSAKDIHTEMSQTLWEYSPSYSTVKTWVSRFKTGCFYVKYEPHQTDCNK